VRARFSSFEEGTITLISLSSDNADELMGQIFIKATQFDEYDDLMLEHFHNDKPYAVLNWSDENEPLFFFRCKDFVQKENLRTGKTLRFQRDPFAKYSSNPETVQADLAKLVELLSGNTKAS
jgi:hypothetical protein